MTMVQLISRRGLFAAASAVSLASCSKEPSVEEEVAGDPYLTLIRQDPMFNWTPPGDMRREEVLSPLNSKGPNPDRFAFAIVKYYVGPGGDIVALMDLAAKTSVTFGYVNGSRQLTPDVRAIFEIARLPGDAGFSTKFKAPVA